MKVKLLSHRNTQGQLASKQRTKSLIAKVSFHLKVFSLRELAAIVIVIVNFNMTRFKLKYHPEESAKRKAEQKSMLTKRVDVFMEFYNKKKFDQVHFYFILVCLLFSILPFSSSLETIKKIWPAILLYLARSIHYLK